MNTIDIIQYHVQNDFNSEVIKEAKMTYSKATFDGFNNVAIAWKPRLEEMIRLDKSGIEIDTEIINDAKYDRNKMIEIIYSKI